MKSKLSPEANISEPKTERSTALSHLRPIPRRGLSRVESSVYVGVSPTLFDEMVKDGRMPMPKRINGRVVWDIRALDEAFETLPDADGRKGGNAANLSLGGDVMKIRLTDGSGTLKLKYLLEERLPSGAVRIRFRRKGSATITLNAPPGTDDFMNEYRSRSMATRSPSKQPESRQRAAIGTLRWLIAQYYGSAEFKRLEPHTQHVRRLILDRLCQSTDANGVRRGDKPYAQMEARNVRILRDEKAATPEAANQVVKMLRQVFAYAVVADLAKGNPAKEVPYLKSGKEGFHTWTNDEVYRFEERHPIGTKARLALALMLYTGQRRSDIIQFGRQHVKNGWLKITQQKNRNRAPITIEIPILPD